MHKLIRDYKSYEKHYDKINLHNYRGFDNCFGVLAQYFEFFGNVFRIVSAT